MRKGAKEMVMSVCGNEDCDGGDDDDGDDIWRRKRMDSEVER